MSMTKSNFQAYALIKFFDKEEHCLMFKNGSSMFRTPHYYRLCEDKGRGDKNESCIGHWDVSLGHEIPNIFINDQPAVTQDVTSVLMYPEKEKTDKWLQSWCVMGPHNDFELSIEEMMKEFGPYFVVLPVQNIEMYAKLISIQSGCEVSFGLVRYSNNPFDFSLTVKDSKFSYQNEFRFFVGECEKNETQDKLLNLQGLNSLLLEADSLKISSPSGITRYLSVGRENIVVV